MSGRENESFLKLIGLENTEAAEDAVNEAVESAPSKEPSWTALLPGSEQHSTKAEWESPQAVEPEVPENSEIPESLESPEPDSWEVPEEIPSDTDSSEQSHAEHTQSVTEEDLARMELSQNTEPAEPTEKTEVYQSDENPTSRLKALTASIRKTVSHAAKSLTLSQFRKATGTRTGGTRPTVAFDYDQAAEKRDGERTEAFAAAESTDGTAHFDYSKEKADHRLVVLEGKVNALAFHLGNLPLRIGRDPTNDVVVDDVNASRFHAEIREQEGGLVVVDLGSTNGVKVNGELAPQKPLLCHDVLQVGDTLFEFLEPGVLSRGKPTQNVVSQEASGSSTLPRVTKHKRKLLIAASIAIVAVGGIYFLSSGTEELVQKAKTAAATEAENSLTTLKAALEKNTSKSVMELAPEEVKKAAISQMESSGFSNLVPPEMRREIESLPAQLVQYFVSEPSALGEVIRLGATLGSVKSVLRRKINEQIKARDLNKAILISELYLLVDPEDKNVVEAHRQIKEIVAAQGSSSASGYTAEEQKFFEYMEQHENFVIKLVDEGRLEDAMQFSGVVVKNLSDLLAQDQGYARVAQDKKMRWEERAESLRKKIEDKALKAKEKEKARDDSDVALREIKMSMDIGDIETARAKIDELLKTDADEESKNEALALQSQLGDMVGRSFETTRQKIEMLVSTESFESAWRELYKFLDVMPSHTDAKEMKSKLEEQTRPRASQFYNQARVYEFEADDLVAAEQYYKKTMEVADPKSDLFDKASRRYAEVKRRSVH